MYYWIWIIVIVLSVIVEACTVSLVSIWFVPAGIVCLILSMLNVEFWIQIASFLVLSAACLFIAKTFLKKKINQKAVPTNADTVIGDTAVVTEDIDNNLEKGAAKVQGKEWTARSKDGTFIKEGTLVTVVEIKGVKLICKEKKEKEN